MKYMMISFKIEYPIIAIELLSAGALGGSEDVPLNQSFTKLVKIEVYENKICVGERLDRPSDLHTLFIASNDNLKNKN